jgi:hypothetical protein
VSFKDVKTMTATMVSTNRPVVYASGGYDFSLNQWNISFKTLFMARYDCRTSFVDFNAMLMINNLKLEECIELIKRLQQWQVL